MTHTSQESLFSKALKGEYVGTVEVHYIPQRPIDIDRKVGNHNAFSPKVKVDGCGDNVTRRRQEVLRMDIWINRRLVVKDCQKKVKQVLATCLEILLKLESTLTSILNRT